MLKTVTQPSRSVIGDGNSPVIALVGCGAIAERYYLPALTKHPSVLENLILVDRDKARAQKVAEGFKVKHCVFDYREILDDVDGVIVALPTDLHHPISMEFLSHGVHVQCEKPLAESADKAREMIEEARRNGVVLSTNYNQRLYASNMKVKELLSDKTLGKPLSIEYFVGEEFDWPTVSGFYFRSKVSSRGVLRDRGAHVLDLICWWLGGKPKLISSENDAFGGSDAVARVQVEYDKCVGEVKLSWLSKFPCRFSVKCEAGTVEGDVYDSKRLVMQTRSDRKKQSELKFKGTSFAGMVYKMVTNFIDVVSKSEKPLIAGSDVLDSIRLIDECYESATRFHMPWYEIPEVQSGT